MNSNYLGILAIARTHASEEAYVGFLEIHGECNNYHSNKVLVFPPNIEKVHMETTHAECLTSATLAKGC